jgi:hypothetical protein
MACLSPIVSLGQQAAGTGVAHSARRHPRLDQRPDAVCVHGARTASPVNQGLVRLRGNRSRSIGAIGTRQQGTAARVRPAEPIRHGDRG